MVTASGRGWARCHIISTGSRIVRVLRVLKVVAICVEELRRRYNRKAPKTIIIYLDAGITLLVSSQYGLCCRKAVVIACTHAMGGRICPSAVQKSPPLHNFRLCVLWLLSGEVEWSIIWISLRFRELNMIWFSLGLKCKCIGVHQSSSSPLGVPR